MRAQGFNSVPETGKIVCLQISHCKYSSEYVGACISCSISDISKIGLQWRVLELHVGQSLLCLVGFRVWIVTVSVRVLRFCGLF
jgi:hypothetical protein